MLEISVRLLQTLMEEDMDCGGKEKSFNCIKTF